MKLAGLIAAAVAAVLLVGGGVAFWWQFLRDDAPPPVVLSSTELTTTTEGSGSEGGSTTAAASADGTWVVAPESFAGYRVRETFAGFTSPSDAVGRSSGVTGSITVEGATVPAAELEVDMTMLQSDSGSRDGALRSRGLETDEFPTASFRLTEPVDLGDPPTAGQPVSATAAGELTLHGVTRPVEIPVEAVWTGDRIEVVGGADVVFGDYDIEAPTTARVVSIEENGVFEFQLFFERS
jgi:polyisoprenoid-binding protein YceI